MEKKAFVSIKFHCAIVEINSIRNIHIYTLYYVGLS